MPGVVCPDGLLVGRLWANFLTSVGVGVDPYQSVCALLLNGQRVETARELTGGFWNI